MKKNNLVCLLINVELLNKSNKSKESREHSNKLCDLGMNYFRVPTNSGKPGKYLENTWNLLGGLKYQGKHLEFRETVKNTWKTWKMPKLIFM